MRQAISILGGGDCSTKAKWFVHIHITIIDQIPDLNSELSTSRGWGEGIDQDGGVRGHRVNLSP